MTFPRQRGLTDRPANKGMSLRHYRRQRPRAGSSQLPPGRIPPQLDRRRTDPELDLRLFEMLAGTSGIDCGFPPQSSYAHLCHPLSAEGALSARLDDPVYRLRRILDGLADTARSRDLRGDDGWPRMTTGDRAPLRGVNWDAIRNAADDDLPSSLRAYSAGAAARSELLRRLAKASAEDGDSRDVSGFRHPVGNAPELHLAAWARRVALIDMLFEGGRPLGARSSGGYERSSQPRDAVRNGWCGATSPRNTASPEATPRSTLSAAWSCLSQTGSAWWLRAAHGLCARIAGQRFPPGSRPRAFD